MFYKNAKKTYPAHLKMGRIRPEIPVNLEENII